MDAGGTLQCSLLNARERKSECKSERKSGFSGQTLLVEVHSAYGLPSTTIFTPQDVYVSAQMLPSRSSVSCTKTLVAAGTTATFTAAHLNMLAVLVPEHGNDNALLLQVYASGFAADELLG